MFLLPIILLVTIGFITYRVMQHRRVPAAVDAGAPAPSGHANEVLPSSPLGWAAMGALALAILMRVLVNVISIPFIGWISVLSAFALAAGARFVQHDRSPAVLGILIVAGAASIAALAFLLGEVFIGHD